MNKNKNILLFTLCATMQLPCIESDSSASKISDEISLRSAEIELLEKVSTGQFALLIYGMLQQCLQENKEMSCRSGFELFNKVKRVFKRRNIPMTHAEETLFKKMEEKYSAGPSYSGDKQGDNHD